MHVPIWGIALIVSFGGAARLLSKASKETGDYNPGGAVLTFGAIVWFVVIWVIYLAYLAGAGWA